MMSYKVGTMTRTTTTSLFLALALGLPGCNGAFWGNLVVLGLTVGIFFGTLSLGRERRAGDATSSKS